MPRIEVEPGVSLYAQDLGSGPAVVFLAGFGMSHPVWEATVAELTEQGRRTVCIDVRGTGDSDKPIDGYGIDRLTADIAAAMDALELASVPVVGWSLGGQLAFHLAATRPDLVSRLVLVASTAVRTSRSERFPFGGRPERVLALVQEAERRDHIASRRHTIASTFQPMRMTNDPTVDFLVNLQLRMPVWAALRTYEGTYVTADLIDEIDRVTVPVLQIVGDTDPVTPLAAVKWLAEQLADARVEVLEGSGHYPMYEARPAFHRLLGELTAA